MSANDAVIMACQASASGPRQDESDAWCVSMVDFTSSLVVLKAPNKGCIICVSISLYTYIYILSIICRISTETLYSVCIDMYAYFFVYLVSQGIDFC